MAVPPPPRSRRRPRLPDRAQTAVSAVRDRLVKAQRARLCPDERRGSTSPPGATQWPDGPRHNPPLDVSDDGARSPAAGCSRPASKACSTASASTARGTCGPRPRTACTSTRRYGVLLGKIPIPETGGPTVCFGGARPQPALHLRDDVALRGSYVRTTGRGLIARAAGLSRPSPSTTRRRRPQRALAHDAAS